MGRTAWRKSRERLGTVLYWSVSPSGKLPYTTAKLASNYGNSIRSGNDSFAEGVFIDYRPFYKANIALRYEFGVGLRECLSSTAMGGLVLELIRGSICNVQRYQYLHHRIPHLWRCIWDYRPRRLLFSCRYWGHCHSCNHAFWIRRWRRGCAIIHRASVDCAIESCEVFRK
jgi:hypothetical protein